jgi:recombinational DNA repair protein RecR
MADISYTPSIERLAQSFRTLPGVGKKSAYRMAFAVLDMPEEKAKAFAAEGTTLELCKGNSGRAWHSL